LVDADAAPRLGSRERGCDRRLRGVGADAGSREPDGERGDLRGGDAVQEELRGCDAGEDEERGKVGEIGAPAGELREAQPSQRGAPGGALGPIGSE